MVQDAQLVTRSVKRCSRCGKVKPLSEFNRDRARSRLDGRQRYCRQCNRAYFREFQQKRLKDTGETVRRFHADSLINRVRASHPKLVNLIPGLFEELSNQCTRNGLRKYSWRWFLNRFTEIYPDWNLETLAEMTEVILQESGGKREVLRDIRRLSSGREFLKLINENSERSEDGK